MDLELPQEHEAGSICDSDEGEECMGVNAGAENVLRDVSGVFTTVNKARGSKEIRRNENEYEKLAVLQEQDAQHRAQKMREAAESRRGTLREQQRKEQARNKVSWGRSGVSLSSGSPLAVQEGRAKDDEKEQLALLAEGEQAASNALVAGSVAANRYRSQAARIRAGNAGSGSNDAYGSVGSLLARGGKVFDY